MRSMPAWSTRASSRTGSQTTEKPCLKREEGREGGREKERKEGVIRICNKNGYKYGNLSDPFKKFCGEAVLS